jgi:hypothetical protein
MSLRPFDGEIQAPDKFKFAACRTSQYSSLPAQSISAASHKKVKSATATGQSETVLVADQ